MDKDTITGFLKISEADEATEDRTEYLPFKEPALSQHDKTKSWLKEYHGYTKKTISGAKFERIISTVLLLVLLAALVTWGIFVYDRMRRKNEANTNEITELRLRFERLKHTLLKQKGNAAHDSIPSRGTITTTERTKREMTVYRPNVGDKESIAIKIIGDGQMERSTAGQPIHSWQKKALIKRGNISFYQSRYIKIERSGLYIVQARMFFKNNQKYSEESLDFGVVKRKMYLGSKTLISTTVPLVSCKKYCTSSVSEIVKLNAGDLLSVQTSNSDQNFQMMKGKSSFACYKLKM